MQLQDLIPRFKTMRVKVYESSEGITIRDINDECNELHDYDFQIGTAKTFTWFGTAYTRYVELD